MELVSLDPVLMGFKERILDAAKNNLQLQIIGGNTKYWYGDVSRGEILNTRDFHGILDYQPAELVITAKAGTLMRDIEKALSDASQMLPFEPPHFGDNATIGGVVCAGLSGPARAQVGSLKDFILGVKIMDGRGDILKFGGQVMKNVAGYDVSRLLAGSMGTLALLLEVSLKVLPKPASSKTLRMRLSQEKAIRQMNLWASQPLSLSASCWLGDDRDGELLIRFAGANAAVESATKKIQEQASASLLDDHEAQAFWYSLKEHQHTFFQNNENLPLWRFAVDPLSSPLPLPGETCIEWLGGQRWYKGHLEKQEAIQIAQKNNGHVTLFKGNKTPTDSVFTTLEQNPLTAPLVSVQNKIHLAFDPHGIFKTNRMP